MTEKLQICQLRLQKTENLDMGGADFIVLLGLLLLLLLIDIGEHIQQNLRIVLDLAVFRIQIAQPLHQTLILLHRIVQIHLEPIGEYTEIVDCRLIRGQVLGDDDWLDVRHVDCGLSGC